MKYNHQVWIYRLNRNILECKCKVKAHTLVNIFSLNRNILECKYTPNTRRSSATGVLIETYWNVNMSWGAVGEIMEVSLNRNILECKFVITWGRRRWKVVLIETYWNVNIDSKLTTALYAAVLIETYWNVNPYRAGFDGQRPFRLNRNILECK